MPPKLAADLRFLDEAYPQIDIEYVKRTGKFGPKLKKMPVKGPNRLSGSICCASK